MTPLTPLLLMATAFAGEPKLTIRVVDAADTPITNAIVSFPYEIDLKHPVNTVTGTMSLGYIYGEKGDDEEFALLKGAVIEVHIEADGYNTQSRTVHMKKKRTAIDVIMLPIDTVVKAPTP